MMVESTGRLASRLTAVPNESGTDRSEPSRLEQDDGRFLGRAQIVCMHPREITIEL